MEWLEITINTAPERITVLSDRLEDLGVEGLVIEDEASYEEFLENNRKYWDYIDEELADSIRGLCRIKFYLAASADGEKQLAELEGALPDETFECKTVRDEDWENNWKQYYKPVEVGERLLIVPEWETAPEGTERAVLRLDPGLIFGTGTHPTTQMCLRAMEKLTLEGREVLDLGCGSGILAIASLLLGAEHAAGVDIDEKAPSVVMENAALNGITPAELEVFAGDVISDTKLKNRLSERSYDVILANIVADVIIALAPSAMRLTAPDGVFICSGIIDGREDEVESALAAAGFKISEHNTQENWHSFICRK